MTDRAHAYGVGPVLYAYSVIYALRGVTTVSEGADAETLVGKPFRFACHRPTTCRYPSSSKRSRA
jgi:hypothetical protein